MDDFDPVTAKAVFLKDVTPRGRAGDIHEPDGLGRRRPTRAGNPRGRDADVGADSLPGPTRHRERTFCAYRAGLPQNLFRHAQQRHLDCIAVGDHASEEIGRASGNARNPVGDKTARARFSCRDRPTLSGKYPVQLFFVALGSQSVKPHAFAMTSYLRGSCLKYSQTRRCNARFQVRAASSASLPCPRTDLNDPPVPPRVRTGRSR